MFRNHEPKKLLQKILPYIIYFLFAVFMMAGFPSFYFFSTGEYISGKQMMPIFFICCFVIITAFERNKAAKKYGWMTTVVSILIVEIFCLLLFAQYHLVWGLLLLIAIAAIWLLYFKQWIKLRPYDKRTKGFIKYSRDKTSIACAYLAVLILIIPSIIGVYKEYIDVLDPDRWEQIVESMSIDKTEAESTVQYDLSSRLSQWDDLDIEERFDLLCEVGVREEKFLGIENYAEIRIAYDKFSIYTLAYYSDEEKLICININELNKASVEECVNSMLHEVYHAFQHHVVRSLDFESEFVKTSFYYAEARSWKNNMENYVSGVVNFEAYEAQPLEASAREHAEERIYVYLSDADTLNQ